LSWIVVVTFSCAMVAGIWWVCRANEIRISIARWNNTYARWLATRTADQHRKLKPDL
jgi:hypothetical protein